MSDYIIYTIECNDKQITDCYVGLTKNFTKRCIQHKTRCNNINDTHHHIKLYKYIRDNGGWNNWKISVLEIYNCINKYDAGKWERHHYEQLNSTLNTVYPTRTSREYYIHNIERFKIKNRLYREAHKK